MKIILESCSSVLSIIRPMNRADDTNRLLRYCVTASVDAGMLIYNLLTKELVLLSEDEYENLTEIEYLKECCFVVPEDYNDKECVDLVKWVLEAKKPKSKNITGYTVFTTTDCNARCFYCYELGCTRVPMSEVTALNAVAFIKKHCGGNEVVLNWYGGEPLFNAKIIDIICDGLRAEGVVFRSKMISNGYLFDDVLVRKAVEQWNLKKIQITLDGTEAVYNKVKAYIYREGSAYQRVLDNIARLLAANIEVSIRMNLDMHNADDLLNLIDELAERFGDSERLSAYAYHIFKGVEPIADLHNEDEWEVRDDAMMCVNDRLVEKGLGQKLRIGKTIKLSHCMADSGNAVTILPDGSVGLCDHFNDREFIGHIERDGFDESVIASWKEKVSDTSVECGGCFYYPSCTMLKKCGTHSVCYEQYRKERLRETKAAMLEEYRRWKEQNVSEDE